MNPSSAPPPAPAPKVVQAPISYETYAPRSSLQRDRLSRIAELTAGPEHRFRKSVVSSASSSGGGHTMGGTESSGTVPPLTNKSWVIRSISASRNEYNEEDEKSELMEDNRDDSMFAFQTTNKCNKSRVAEDVGESLAIQQSQQMATLTTACLSNSLKYSKELKEELHKVIEKAQELQHRHSELLKHSGELALQCERLQQEEAILSEHAADIGHPLQHYDAVDAVALQLGVLFKERNGQALMVVKGLPRLKVDPPEDYTAVLDQVYEAMAYFTQHQQPLSQGAIYATKATALHEAALRLIQEAVADRITTITSDVQQSNPNDSSSTTTTSSSSKGATLIIPADKLEASLIYTRFHGISSRSNSLLMILQQRMARPVSSYRELLEHCQRVYCSSRDALLQPSIRKHVEKLKEEHGLVGMTRLASVFLMRVCTVETNLYLDFFGIPPPVVVVDQNDTHNNMRKLQFHAVSKNKPSSVLDDEPFQHMLAGLCSPLHRVVRRGVVLLSDLDVLCQIVSVLREERAAANSSTSTRAVARSMSSMIEDAQERLIFCTLSTLTKDVVKFKPTPSDLDYPRKLQAPSTNVDDDAVHAQLQIYESWFPPMKAVLKVLSKLFRVVDPKVFEDIAFQAVQSCTKTLKEAAIYIRNKEGFMDADLFLVKHLLILREQLSPFDIQLRAVERQLDFSEAGKAVTKFLASRNRRIFSMSTENALLTLLREGVSVHEASMDSKRDLEDALRSACNDFIEHSSVQMAGPLLGLVDSCKSATAALSSTATTTNTNTHAKALRDQPFMKADKVQTTLYEAKECMKTQLSPIQQQMAAYLESAAAQSILLKPVMRKISRALEDLKRFVTDIEECEANGWNDVSKADTLGSIREIEQFLKEPGTFLFKASSKSTT